MKPILSLQVPGKTDRYEDFHRVECDSTHADDLHAALDRIIAQPATTRITPVNRATKWKRKPAVRGDEDAQLKEAIQGIAVAA
jgi:hypothetical protein